VRGECANGKFIKKPSKMRSKIRPKIDAKSIQIVVAGRYRRTPKDSGYFRTGVWG
jgi:hypothetical protein